MLRCCMHTAMAYVLHLPVHQSGSKRSVGFVGHSDGWRDLHQHKKNEMGIHAG